MSRYLKGLKGSYEIATELGSGPVLNSVADIIISKRV